MLTDNYKYKYILFHKIYTYSLITSYLCCFSPPHLPLSWLFEVPFSFYILFSSFLLFGRCMCYVCLSTVALLCFKFYLQYNIQGTAHIIRGQFNEFFQIEHIHAHSTWIKKHSFASVPEHPSCALLWSLFPILTSNTRGKFCLFLNFILMESFRKCPYFHLVWL